MVKSETEKSNESEIKSNESEMDLINRQAAIDVVRDADVIVLYHDAEPVEEAIEEAIEATKRSVTTDIEQLPSAQPEIIRCMDCKHWDGEKRGQFWYFEQCSLNQHIASCDDYCSFAERRTNGSD